MKINFLQPRQLGAALWVCSLQYYLLQAIAASYWSNIFGFSWRQNTISDLGNTACGPYGDRLVCSPLHSLMNASFIVLGLTMMFGAWLLSAPRKASQVIQFGFAAMALAGIGTILVGLFPENTISTLHIVGAALPFVFGNLSMLVLGINLRKLPHALRIYTIGSGIVGLLALLLFLGHAFLGVQLGGMERLIAYPQSLWMIVFGCYLLLHPKDIKKLTR